jgi:dTDP-4-dehydrorhamnose 3,5-epimerase-like enzyme
MNLIKFREYHEPDGTLVPIELESELPFTPKRLFWITGVPSGTTRADHAHKTCHQLIVPIAGGFDAKYTRPGIKFWNFAHMENDRSGLYIPPMNWLTLYNITPDAVILVLASHAYDPADYINDELEWLKCRASQS